MKPVNEVCKALDECNYYVVEISQHKGNPPHKAILYTGFNSGGYRALFEPTYDKMPSEAIDHRAICKVINKIEGIGKS